MAIRAKFAPSMTNLFMAKWEEEVVLSNRRPELVLWIHFIDDILFIWGGDKDSLESYLGFLNIIERGIVLQGQIE